MTDQRLSNSPNLLTTIKSGIMPPPIYMVITIITMMGFLSIRPCRVRAYAPTSVSTMLSDVPTIT